MECLQHNNRNTGATVCQLKTCCSKDFINIVHPIHYFVPKADTLHYSKTSVKLSTYVLTGQVIGSYFAHKNPYTMTSSTKPNCQEKLSEGDNERLVERIQK